MLEVKNLSKEFSESKAVDQIDLVIEQGEFFALLGPSGCGKTTLLRMIAGLESPTSGQILFQGQRVDHLAPHERHFNTVFQRYALFPHLNVFQNVGFGLQLKKIPAKVVQDRVLSALSLVQMESFVERPIQTLSGGQQQRIALARALVNEPKVLLLDEPLSALDLKLRTQMQAELMKIQRQLNITFIFVTHDQDEALTMADRMAVMRNGRVEQVGKPKEVYEKPKNRYVAEFIGQINRIPGDTLEKPAESAFFIRPEKLKVIKTKKIGTDPGLRTMAVVVQEAVFKGALTHFILSSAKHPQCRLSVVVPNSHMATTETWDHGDRGFVYFYDQDCCQLGDGQ